MERCRDRRFVGGQVAEQSVERLVVQQVRDERVGTTGGVPVPPEVVVPVLPDEGELDPMPDASAGTAPEASADSAAD